LENGFTNIMGNPFILDLGLVKVMTKKKIVCGGMSSVPDDLTDVLDFFIGNLADWQDTLVWNDDMLVGAVALM
jgi:hypothetical protein